MNRTWLFGGTVFGVLIGFLAGYFASHPGLPAATSPRDRPTAAAAGAAAVPTKPATFTVATYNVRNLFDRDNNPYTADEGTNEKPPEEVKHLAAAIREVDADVLILQEVESGGILKRFVKDYLADLRYTAVVDTITEDARGITVTALSRFPVLRVVSHRLTPINPAAGGSETNRLSRDLVRIDVEIQPGTVITVYGVHLKSKRSADDGSDPQSAKRRLAEAVRVRDILRTDMPPGERFILLGDCNDDLASAPVRALRDATIPPLADALASIPAADRITFANSRYREAIDQILVSPAAWDVSEPRIFTGPVFEKASDHRPVRITLKTR